MIATSIASPVFPSLSPKTLALDVPKPTSVSLSLGFSPKPISVSASFLSSVNASSRPFIRRVAVLDLEQDQEVLSDIGQPSFWLEQQFLSLPYTIDLAQLAGVFEGAFDVQTAEERNGRALRVNCGPSPPKSEDSSSRRARVARSKGGGHGRIRFRKQHRGRLKGVSHRGNRICFGRYALQALEPAWITTRQIEAGRRAMTRNIRRGGRIWVRIFPDKPVTVRPTDSRMGSGKGSPEFWVAVVKPGRIIYEMSGVTENVARIAMSIAASKMPIRTQFIVSG